MTASGGLATSVRSLVVLTADRRFNSPLLYASSWREAPIVAPRAS
jgi:hypothetical protein